MRLFAAISLPDDVRVALAAIDHPTGPRWVGAHALHLTVRFFGDTPADRLPALIDALAAACAPHPTFTLRVAGTGAFGRSVLWAGVTGDVGALHALAADVERAAVAVGYAAEGRPYHPHVTLARLKAPPPPIAVPDTPPFAVDHVDLMESRLRSTGAEYGTVHRVGLRRPASAGGSGGQGG